MQTQREEIRRLGAAQGAGDPAARSGVQTLEFGAPRSSAAVKPGMVTPRSCPDVGRIGGPATNERDK